MSALVAAGMTGYVPGATLCVNPGGTGGCYATINAAVTAAANHDIVRVAAGTYKEDVVIGRPLSLVGSGSQSTIIDAAGMANGVYIDGLDHLGLNNVLVAAFTVRNANFEGILITNASNSVIYNNRVINNNKALDITTFSCPGLPAFETAESEDCGEGIHLVGADHTTVQNNVVQNNAGGILMSDETAPTHDNLISGNTVANNPYDCGITMASHPPASGTAPFGVIHNTILNNQSTHNGYQVPGAGAGIGIFTFLPGGTVTGNVVVGNVVMNNGLPGVTFHAHGPQENLNDNVIAGNTISGNGPDTEDAATPGPTGINVYGLSAIMGTIISQNVIDGEMIDIAVNTPAEVQAHFNNFHDATYGIDNLGTGIANGTENWWGCSGGPGATGCATTGGLVRFAPWLTNPF
ncbi:MAG: right-handed parallel beta-helix repeat-containing protein [Bryobacteraceae bacterium]